MMPSVIAPLPLVWLAALGPVEGLEQARILANDDPGRFADGLATAIDEFEADPSTASDPDGQALRLRSLLTLSRAYLANDDESSAAKAMDRAIRAAMGHEVPASDFGPSLTALYETRLEALGAPGSLEIACASPCVAVVNARAVEAGSHSVVPGPYVAEISGTDGGGEASFEVSVTSGETSTITWPGAPATSAPEPEPSAPATNSLDAAPPDHDRNDGRLLPRWAEITGLVLGAGAMGAGAALLVIDGTCQGGGSPSGPNACDDLFETTAAGAATLAVGGTALITSGALLIVDEVRTRDGGKQTVIGLGWRGRF